MILTVKPSERLPGTVTLPASKSYSIRAFLTAACGGESVIIRPSGCDDARVACRTAQALGARIEQPNPGTFRVVARDRLSGPSEFDVGESGTVLRFLLPLLPFYRQQARIVGAGTLIGRPNHLLTAVLREQGVDIRGTGPLESVPLILSGGCLRGGNISIDGSLSSQFISALLIACPRTEQDTHLIIKGGQMVSADYITMTRLILARAGLQIRKINDRYYEIPGGQTFQGLGEFRVPSDYGLAAFLLAAGILTRSPLVCAGHLDPAWPQADGRIMDFLTRMGARFEQTDQGVQLLDTPTFQGGNFSLKDCPDLVPIMAVLALFAQGKTRLLNIRHARVKESDRISDLRAELLKIGARIQETENSLTISPQPGYQADVELDPHRDHRLAMAFAVLGLRIGVRIRDMECVAKSYPEFVDDFRQLGAPVSTDGPDVVKKPE